MTRCLGSIVALLAVVASGACTAAVAGTKDHPARTASLGTTVESTDRALSAALFAETLVPSAEAHLHVGREYFRIGVLDAALGRAERALKKDPRLAAAHDLNARIWREWGQPTIALGHAHRALYLEPNSGVFRNTLGTILMALDRFDEARAAFLRAADDHGVAALALSNACYLEYRLGQFEQARRRCEEAVKVDPGLTTAHNNLGLVHAAAGDLKGGREAFMAAGDIANAYYNLGIVLLSSARYSDAADAFEAAARQRVDFTAAKTRAHEARMRALRPDVRR